MSTNKLNLVERIKGFPNSPGIYIMKNAQNKILYIGKAKSLRSRIRSYFNEKKPTLKNQFLIHQMKIVDYIMTDNEVEAFLLEASLIKKHKPRYNVRLTDDKNYPYIRCSVKDKFPRLYFERKVKDSKSLYFGPYTQGFFTRHIIDFLNQNFQLRDCSDSNFKTRSRPCLTHQMGFCTAPCVSFVDEKKYKHQFQKAIRFLRGQHVHLAKSLEKKMEVFSKNLRFEEAGRVRDYLKAISMIDQNQSIIQKSDKDRDVVVSKGDERGSLVEFLYLRKGRLIGSRYHFLSKIVHEEENLLSYLNQYYEENIIPDEILLDAPIKKSQIKILEKVLSQRKGESCRIYFSSKEKDLSLIQMALKNAENHFKDELKQGEDHKKILIEIQQKFHLKQLPLRIECYDISHWKGSHVIGSQVVFKNGLPFKKDYRLYSLKKATKEDDYASLQEVLERRLKHTEYENPHLILIDGGRGQLHAVQKIMESLNRQDIPIVSLAKDRIKEKVKYSSSISSSGERFYLVGRKNPVSFLPSSKAFHLLLHLRDEAHRFAIESHRKKREKTFLLGDLDEIKGLGVKRKKRLLDHFRSLESLAQASEKEISSIPFVSQKVAREIRLYFSKRKK